jgi:uncharacterized protein (TIGR02246 family)
MRSFDSRFLTVITVMLAAGVLLPAAEPTAARDQDAEAIRAASREYIHSLEKGDGAALARFWTPDGDIGDDLGRTLPGRETVALIEPSSPASASVRPAKPATSIQETSLRFVAPDVAIEDGTVEVAAADARGPLRGRYTATWVRHEGAWKLAAIREARLDHAAGAESLADLDWMVGDWAVVDDPTHTGAAQETGRPTMEMRVRWNATRSFLLRDMKITPAGAAGAGADVHISQRIGWDPLSHSIHSWVFSSDGSHGEADWRRDDGSWVARTTSVHPDGRQTSSINIYTFDGKDRCTWRSVPTHVGGEHDPHINLTMIRKPASSKAEEAGR